MRRVLVVDDDLELCGILLESLRSEGFGAEAVHDGKEGLRRVLSEPCDMVVLDISIPLMGGFQVLREIRSKSDVPILMITGRGSDTDRIVGLELGADDYLPKPFNVRELLARIRAILRRMKLGSGNGTARPGNREKTVAGDIVLDPNIRIAYQDGRPVDLTYVEFNVLELLLRNAGRVLSREELAVGALGRGLGIYDRSVDMHISKLRKKLGRHCGGIERITTIRGSGYLYTLAYHPNRLEDMRARSSLPH